MLLLCNLFAYSTKECSRVADNPTLVADQLMDRLLLYLSQTRDAALTSKRSRMPQCTPPPTRKKPGDADPEIYNMMKDYNLDDGVAQPDQQEMQQDFCHPNKIVTAEINFSAYGASYYMQQYTLIAREEGFYHFHGRIPFYPNNHVGEVLVQVGDITLSSSENGV